jgi:hypothetical protein
MPDRMSPPDPDRVALVAQLADAPLPPADFVAQVSAPISEEERAAALSLIEWFTRRYPTAGDRLAYARRAYARWRQSFPASGPPGRES